MEEESALEKLQDLLQGDFHPDKLSVILDDLKYMSYGNKRRKRELLSKSALSCLVTVFKRDDVLDIHRESIFDIFGSLLKCDDGVCDGTVIKKIFEIVFEFIRKMKLGLSALRCMSAIVRSPLPEFVARLLNEEGSGTEVLRALLTHNSQMESHFLLRILSVLIREPGIREELVELGVYDAIYPKIFSNDLQELEWALQCMLHILSLSDRLAGVFWRDPDIVARVNALLCPYFPVNIQIATARCFLFTAQKIAEAKESILRGCVLTLLRYAQSDVSEQWRAEAVELLRTALALRTEPTQDEDSRSLKEMLHCVLPTATSSTHCSPFTADLESNALLVISQLLMNCEESRLTVQPSLVTATATRFTRSSPPRQVKSLLRALHSLSRSVHHLKTTFDNRHFVDFVMDCLLNESDCEYLALACGFIANLSLHLCAARVYLVEAIAPLAALAQRNKNPSITLNAVWALMNLSCRSTAEVKLSILNHFASSEALALAATADEQLIEKMLALYRNLYYEDPCSREPADVLSSLSRQHEKNASNVLKLVKRAFASDYSSHTKEVALSVLSNMCAVGSCQMIAGNDEAILGCIMNELRSADENAHFGAVLAVYNLLCGCERHRRSLQPLLANSALPHLLSHIQRVSSPHNVHLIRRVDDTIRQLMN